MTSPDTILASWKGVILQALICFASAKGTHGLSFHQLTSFHPLSQHSLQLWAALELPHRTCCISAAGGRNTPDSPAVTAPQRGREKKNNQTKIFILATFVPRAYIENKCLTAMGSGWVNWFCGWGSQSWLPVWGHAKFQGRDHRAWRHNHQFIPSSERPFSALFLPKKAYTTGRRAGQRREGKGCSCWVGFLVPATSLEKNLSLGLHTAWGTTCVFPGKG